MRIKLKSLISIIFSFLLVFACIFFGTAGKASAEEGVREVNDKSAGYFVVENSRGQISENEAGAGYVITGTKENGFQVVTAQPHQADKFRFSMNIDSLPYNEITKIYENELVIRLSSQQDYSAGKYLRIILRKQMQNIVAELALIENNEVKETLDGVSGLFYEDIYTGSGDRKNVQLYLGGAQKFAIDVEGVQDGALIDIDIFQANCSTMLAKELAVSSELYREYRKLTSSPVYLSMEAVSTGDSAESEGEFSVTVLQHNENNFYTYYRVPSAELNGEDAINYSKVSIRWDVQPYDQYQFNGFIVDRKNLASGKVEKKVTLNSRLSSVLNDTRMVQATDYEYTVSAYMNLDNPVPKTVLLYDPLKLTTRAGSLGKVLIIVGGIVIGMVIVALVYIFWFDIKNKRH